jgi:hypothetical protein
MAATVVTSAAPTLPCMPGRTDLVGREVGVLRAPRRDRDRHERRRDSAGGWGERGGKSTLVESVLADAGRLVLRPP